MTSTLDYCRMLACIYQSFCETALTFHNDLRIWSAEVVTSRSDAGWKWGYSVGVGECEKPEDPGYLLLLAAPQTKRGLNAFFPPPPVWLQTMRGFESTHDSHGNGFWVPTIMWNASFFLFFKGGKSNAKNENIKHKGSKRYIFFRHWLTSSRQVKRLSD